MTKMFSFELVNSVLAWNRIVVAAGSLSCCSLTVEQRWLRFALREDLMMRSDAWMRSCSFEFLVSSVRAVKSLR